MLPSPNIHAACSAAGKSIKIFLPRILINNREYNSNLSIQISPVGASSCKPTSQPTWTTASKPISKQHLRWLLSNSLQGCNLSWDFLPPGRYTTSPRSCGLEILFCTGDFPYINIPPHFNNLILNKPPQEEGT